MNDLDKANKYSLKLFAFLAVLIVVSAAFVWGDLESPLRWLTLGGIMIVTGTLFVVSETARIGIRQHYGFPDSGQHLLGQALVIAGAALMLYTMSFGI